VHECVYAGEKVRPPIGPPDPKASQKADGHAKACVKGPIHALENVPFFPLAHQDKGIVAFGLKRRLNGWKILGERSGRTCRHRR